MLSLHLNTYPGQKQLDPNPFVKWPAIVDRLSVRRLWALWHAAMTPYTDSAILSHLPLTTGNKVFLMLTNGATALFPQTAEGHRLFIVAADGIMKLRRDLTTTTTTSLPFMRPQSGTS